MKFRQQTKGREAKWTRWRGRAGGTRFVIDLAIRPLYPHTARELQQPYLEPDGQGGESIPPERVEDYGMEIADHLIARLGDPEDPKGVCLPTCDDDCEGHPHGLEADFTKDSGLLVGAPDAAEYGMAVADESQDVETEERPWPMSPPGKYALLNMMPGLQQFVTKTAKEIATPLIDEKRQKEDDDNLSRTPSSEQTSRSATAGDEK